MSNRHIACVLLSWWLAAAAGAGEAPGGAKEPSPRPLTIALYQRIPEPGIDPHFTSSFVASSIIHHFYEGLMGLDPDGRIVPQLAERHQALPGNITRFFLRPGVRFHDGTHLSEKDVLASIERAKRPESIFRTRLAQVVRWSSPKAGVVDIETDGPLPLLLPSLATIMIAPRDTGATPAYPIGTGPYRWIKGYQPDPDRLDIEAFPDHWSGREVPPRVAFVFEIDHQRRAELLIQGKADLVAALDSAHHEAVESHSELWVESRLGSKVVGLELRVDQGPFSDPRLRRAFDLMLDRSAVAKDVFFNLAKPASQLTSPGVFGYVPEMPIPKRNLAEARKLLAEAGIETGARFTLHAPEAQARLCEELRRQAAEAGLNLDIQLHPNRSYYHVIDERRPPLFVVLWTNSMMDASWLFDVKIHTATAEGLGETNRSGFSDPEVDTLIRKAATLGNAEARYDLLETIAGRIADERPILPIVWFMNLYGVRRSLKWQPRLDGRVYAFEVGTHSD